MFARTFHQRVAANAMRVKQYAEHLTAKEGKELIPLADLMPAAHDGMAQALEFQKLYVEHQVRQHGGAGNLSAAVRAWTSTLSGDGLLRNMGHHDAIYAPVPGDMVTVSSAPYDPTLGAASNLQHHHHHQSKDAKSAAAAATLVTVPKRRKRVQSIEMTLACQMDPESMSTPDPKIVRVAPAALLRGSRYPFYAPNTPGFASDLASCVHLAIGPAVDYETLPFELLGMGTVLSHEIEPVAVGYIHKYNLDAALAACVHVHNNFDATLRGAGVQPANVGENSGRTGWWFTTGCLARVPIGSTGNYKADFGLLGSTLVRVSE